MYPFFTVKLIERKKDGRTIIGRASRELLDLEQLSYELFLTPEANVSILPFLCTFVRLLLKVINK